MPQNLDVFNHDVRITTCKNCGAPLNCGAAGGSSTCEYCSAENQVAPLWASGGISRWGGAASVSESERIAQLRLQTDKPHPEPKIEFVVDGIVPKYFVRQAAEKWKEMRVQLEKSNAFTLKEQLFFLTLHLAPSLDETSQRAFLETAIEILDDERYRQILLGLLVRIAARKGNVTAASDWLAYLNPYSMDLEMDTAYRYAASTIAAATADTAKLGEILGFNVGDIPLSHRDKTPCRLLQIHAVELSGDIEKAGRALWAEVNDLGEKTVKQELERHLPLVVCPQSVAWVEAQQKQQAADNAVAEIESARQVYLDRIERFQQKIDLHKGARYKTYGLATLIVTGALVVPNLLWTKGMISALLLLGYAAVLSIVLYNVRSSRRTTLIRLQKTLRETEEKLAALDRTT